MNNSIWRTRCDHWLIWSKHFLKFQLWFKVSIDVCLEVYVFMELVIYLPLMSQQLQLWHHEKWPSMCFVKNTQVLDPHTWCHARTNQFTTTFVSSWYSCGSYMCLKFLHVSSQIMKWKNLVKKNILYVKDSSLFEPM